MRFLGHGVLRELPSLEGEAIIQKNTPFLFLHLSAKLLDIIVSGLHFILGEGVPFWYLEYHFGTWKEYQVSFYHILKKSIAQFLCVLKDLLF